MFTALVYSSVISAFFLAQVSGEFACEDGEFPFPSPAEDGKIICVDLRKMIPKSAAKPEDPIFHLFTKENPDDAIILSSNESNWAAISEKAPRFERRAPLKVLVHGFQSASTNPFPKDMMHIYLTQTVEEVPNVILVDWSPIAADYMYYRAAGRTRFVGDAIAELIRALVAERLTSLDKIHMIGHSLGAHISGFAGKEIAGSGGGKIARITGLDPAGPNFCDEDSNSRLSPNDADFVMAVHTDDGNYCRSLFGKFLHWWRSENGLFGNEGPHGHADFYPNGGQEQPGCSLASSCSHSRSHELMQESIGSPRAFLGQECDDWGTYKSGGCGGGKQVIMGEFTPTSARGKFYLRTGQAFPFSLV